MEGISTAAHDVLAEHGREALQYSQQTGTFRSANYCRTVSRQAFIPARADMIQIVNGSQQCLDLMERYFLKGIALGMESPGYLGAIEHFHCMSLISIRPPRRGRSRPGSLLHFWIHIPHGFFMASRTAKTLGRTYSQQKRKDIAALLETSGTVFYEDDAFGELFFDGKPRRPVSYYLPEQSVLSGSFSKIVAPA